MLSCPSCSSTKIVKNGCIHNGKQRFKCNECNRQFVENPQQIIVSKEKRELIDRLWLERISLAGIARAVEVSKKWLQTYVNQKYASVQEKLKCHPKKRQINNTV